jgi:hypothetical protein
MTGPAPYQRGDGRLPEALWRATLVRIRGEFSEMPCMRVTPDQARTLFGLSERVANGVLNRLTDEGFLARTDEGEFVRRQATP